MNTMQFTQYQIESAETEKYADNHKLLANTLGLLAEVGEFAEDVTKLIVAVEEEQNLTLAPIKNALMEAKYYLYQCGKIEKSIRKHKSLGNGATREEERDFQKAEFHPSPEWIEHLEGEGGDVLFHLSRALASVNIDIEHCAIKNRMKLSKRLASNTISDHTDH